jgi:hypothetical protein
MKMSQIVRNEEVILIYTTNKIVTKRFNAQIIGKVSMKAKRQRTQHEMVVNNDILIISAYHQQSQSNFFNMMAERQEMYWHQGNAFIHEKNN